MSSKRRVRRRACASKIAHPTRESGFASIARLAKAGKADGRLLVYPCGFCGKWHVGHAPNEGRRR